MTTIYSGLFTHENGMFPTDWTNRAIKRQQKYCDRWGFDYRLETEISWGQNYPLRHAWSFGTLIKFVALDRFLKSNEQLFTWIDLDVYPTDRAFNYVLPFCNLINAPFVEFGFSDQPGHEHMRCKRTWCGHKTNYFAINSGMFRLNRETGMSLWSHINKDSSVESDAWWQSHYERQLSFSRDKPWMFGSEEAIMEDWFNSHPELQFEQLVDAVHSVHAESDPIFMHYYGTRKAEYPLET